MTQMDMLVAITLLLYIGFAVCGFVVHKNNKDIEDLKKHKANNLEVMMKFDNSFDRGMDLKVELSELKRELNLLKQELNLLNLSKEDKECIEKYNKIKEKI